MILCPKEGNNEKQFTELTYRREQPWIKIIVIKSLLNGVISWLVVALLLCLVNDRSFVQAFTALYAVTGALAAFVGSYIGYARKAKK